ncbi:four helix bundle protein [Gracilimonas mengyeensis]|uniref:Four helix bundle protein n=1 Tax=Gracilimonas mengyeensis TaxID=1302730 RepID=A0A521CBS7_9BACT|nr:four helix bundle protein [Gracilimonas mengyeensis]SMO56892.1 four helix bundle protein [Gracilimonas mengyeensis]
MNKLDLAQKMQKRTKAFALAVIELSRKLPKSREANVISYQIIKSATSVAANYRAACRGRSAKEFYAKICIVVEEADETVFWLEMIQDAKLAAERVVDSLMSEGEEILAIVAKSKHTAGEGLAH